MLAASCVFFFFVFLFFLNGERVGKEKAEAGEEAAAAGMHFSAQSSQIRSPDKLITALG